MSEFRRYRDEHGHEFSSAVSDELARSKGLKDITSDTEPALNRDGQPRAAKPAPRKQAAAVKKVTTSAPATTRQGNTTEGA